MKLIFKIEKKRKNNILKVIKIELSLYSNLTFYISIILHFNH